MTVAAHIVIPGWLVPAPARDVYDSLFAELYQEANVELFAVPARAHLFGSYRIFDSTARQWLARCDPL